MPGSPKSGPCLSEASPSRSLTAGGSSARMRDRPISWSGGHPPWQTRVLRRHVRPAVSLHPRARREPRPRVRESRVQSVEIARMVDVNERAEARHDYRCVERNRDRCVGRRLRRRELAVAVGDRLLAVAWALAQGTGSLARRRQLVRIAEVSGRRDLGAKALDALGREPLLEVSGGQRVRAPGTVGSPPRDQSPVGVHPSAGSTVLPVGKPRGPVPDLELSAGRAARRRSYWRQADEASAEDEVAHSTNRGTLRSRRPRRPRQTR